MPFFESQNLEGAFFGCLRFVEPFIPLEKQLESVMEAFCLFLFEKRLILNFSGREFVSAKIR